MWRFETLEEETRFDSLLHVRASCDDPATELGCNDDILEGQIRNSRVDVALDEGDVAWVIVDAWGEGEGGRFALGATLVPTLEPGAECDPQGERAVCPAGHFCRLPEEAFEAEGFIPGQCELSATPVLESATARIVGEALVLSVVGSDASKDVVGLSVQFLQNGVPIRMGRRGGGRDTFDVGFDASVYGQEAFQATRTSEEILRFGTIDGVRLAILDSEGNHSEWAELVVEEAPEVAAGGACDLRGVDNTCELGAVCVNPPAAGGEPDPGAVAGVCKVPTRPSVIAVEAFLNARTQAIGLRVTGADPDGDIRGLSVRLFDAEGQRVPSSPDGPGAAGAEMELMFGEADVQWGPDADGNPGAFTAQASRALPADWAGIMSVRLRVFDATDLQSDQAEAEFVPTPDLGEGERCDAGGGLGACPGEQICDPASAGCTEPIAECPADWDVIDLMEFAHENGRYVYRGSTEGARDHTAGAGGSCGGGAGQDIFSFTVPGELDAPAAQWVFETDTEGRFDDTVMYIRSHCRYEGPIAELACNDDVEAGQLTASRIGLLLAPGEIVYIFVDGWMGDGFGWRGQYSLVATAL